MRILVTGGAGFIGSNFVRYVLSEVEGIEIVTLDALTYAGSLDSLTDVADDPRHRFVRGDICDTMLVDALVADVDAIVNLAAESHVDRSIQGPTAFLRTNVTGAAVVFEAARRHRVPRVLHISTDEVYGSIASPGTFVEGDALEPNSPYSASKAGADLLARAYAQTYGFPITVTRTTNNLGPWQHPEKLVPRFTTRLIDGLGVPLYGDGGNVRDWLHVDDNAAAQWLALTDGVPGQVYNVGAGNEVSNLELTHQLLERFGLTGTAADERIEFVADRPGHDLRYSVDASRIRALGWSPSHTLETALDDTVAWYRTHEHWWRPLTHPERSVLPPSSE